MSQERIHHPRIMKSVKYQDGSEEQYASFLDCHCVRIIVSLLIWQQSWAAEIESVMREKKGERCRCGGKERREEEGRHAWELCGRCLKMRKEDDENKMSHFQTGFLSFFSFNFMFFTFLFSSLNYFLVSFLSFGSSFSILPLSLFLCFFNFPSFLLFFFTFLFIFLYWPCVTSQFFLFLSFFSFSNHISFFLCTPYFLYLCFPKSKSITYTPSPALFSYSPSIPLPEPAVFNQSVASALRSNLRP